jgi:hypothetical protein
MPADQLTKVIGPTAQLKKSNLMAGMIDYIIRAINDVDEAVVAERVAKIQAAQPGASPEELSNSLIKHKCLQAGAVGAVTSALSMAPGGGTLVTITFGVAADLSLTLKMQAELVLEIAIVYNRRLRRAEKRQVILFVTGLSAAGDQLLTQAGVAIAKRASERLAAKSVEKAMPVLSVAASAGKNILTTYIVGKRAQAYFSLGPEAVADWDDSFRAITGIDARQLTAWLIETTERSWQLVRRQLQAVTTATIVAGQSAGDVVVVESDKMSQQLARAGRTALDAARGAGEMTLDVGKKVGGSVAAAAAGAGRTVAGGIKSAANLSGPKIMATVPSPSLTPDTPTEDIQAILDLTGATARVQAVTAGCSTYQEMLAAFEIYFSKGLQLPFTATWRDPDEAGHAEPITVLGLNSVDMRRGLLLSVQRDKTSRRLLAEQVWSDENRHPNALILNDFRFWLDRFYG